MARKTSDVSVYHKLVAAQITELENWVAADPAAQQRLAETVDRSVRDYCDEYSYKYAIVAYLAEDIGYPGANVMLDAYQQFSPAIEELFS